jgi:hypothetical protein
MILIKREILPSPVFLSSLPCLIVERALSIHLSVVWYPTQSGLSGKFFWKYHRQRRQRHEYLHSVFQGGGEATTKEKPSQ